ncbi:N-acetylglucosamine-6-phosphate deacetylase [Cohnella sp. GCM10012308]|uniref:N-acetylglucosamine-6-phosphate deacetylase n=1 Tax=Cohnella sp. GCM10012308 TaxID=3317329 RepID=UPI00360D6A50
MMWKGRDAVTGQAVEVTVSQERIVDVRSAAEPQTGAEDLPWISAGWIDLQVNGFGGYDLNGEMLTPEDLEGVVRALHPKGVSAFLPTIITGPIEQMRRAFGTIAGYVREGRFGSRSIVGIHMEGPYLSGEDGSRGAHPAAHIRDPDWDEFQRLQETAEGLIRMVTIAPERKGAIPFIRRLSDAGVVVAIGHTRAGAEQLEEAVQAGARVSTHLGNGSEPMLPRHPNYIWQQLADDRLWATFIPDGHHLAPPVLKAMLRVKRDKALFVSDSVRFGGMAPGAYSSPIGGQVVLQANGLLHTAANPNILAGSASSLADGIANAVRFTDLSLAEAVQAVTIRPARVMGFEALGALRPGMRADLTLFRYEPGGAVDVTETVAAGESVYRQLA